jgi:hypothetical protein
MDTTHTVIVGLPVAVTYNATTGHWEVDVDLSELVDAVNENDTDADAEAVLEAWAGFEYHHRKVAVAPIRFLPEGAK